MTKKQELEIVKELIKDGYDNLDTISFELDIPMETLRKIKREVDKEKIQAIQNSMYVSSKMQTMKDKYRALFYGTEDISEDEEEHEINEKVEKQISKIASLIEETDAVNRAFGIVKILKEIENEKFSNGQVESIVNLLYNKDLFYIPPSTNNNGLIRMMQKYKQRYVSKLAQEVGQRKNKINDVLELRKLKSTLTGEMEKEFSICISPVKMQIESKISKIIRESALKKIEDDTSNEMKKIVSKLISKDTDIESLKKDVEDEINRKMNMSKDNRFALNYNQQKDQVFYQINAMLKSKSDIYMINDEDETIDRIKLLFGKDEAGSLKTVVGNYLARKEFKKAYDICDKFEKKDIQFGSTSKMVKVLRQNIKCAEIGEIILRGIKADASKEELENFKYAVQHELQKYGIKPSCIPLGKNKDKTLEITLADIMPSEKEKV